MAHRRRWPAWSPTRGTTRSALALLERPDARLSEPTAHAGLSSLGADPASGTTWLLCIAGVVAVVRVALLPLTIHGVRVAHASARARPELQELAERYRNRKDAESMRAFLGERRRVAVEHHVSRLGCLPLLVQLPIWLSLYHLLAVVAAGEQVGAMGPELVTSLGAATLLGVPLVERATSAPAGRTWPWSRGSRARPQPWRT